MRALDPEQEERANQTRREKQRAYWASPEGKAVRKRLSEERRGRQTEAHKRAMADPVVQQRRTDGIKQWAAQLLGVVPYEEDPNHGRVTDEERAVAAREGERPDGA